jgi:D-3-phosphoglycerate dehydrogenase
MRVFLTHNPEDLDAYYGRALPELQRDAVVVVNPLDRDLTTDELIDHAAGCEVIVAHRATPGEAALFDRSPDLVAFLRTAVDISTVDVPAASANGVLVAHADKSFVPSTAELALGLILDVARNVSRSTVDYRNGVEPPQRPGFQLRGKTAGIIGYGAVGRYLAQLLRGLGVEVLVSDPYVDAVDDGFEQADLDDLLARSDVVVPLAASTPETEQLIDADALARMRPGAVLVNVSRGELLDEDAVVGRARPPARRRGDPAPRWPDARERRRPGAQLGRAGPCHHRRPDAAPRRQSRRREPSAQVVGAMTAGSPSVPRRARPLHITTDTTTRGGPT